MTPKEGFDAVQAMFKSGNSAENAKVLAGVSDKLLMLRLEHGIQLAKEHGKPLNDFMYLTVPEIKRRPSTSHILVAFKLQGLI